MWTKGHRRAISLDGCRITRYIYWTPGGHIVAWYSGAERIFGYAAEEVVGQHVSFLYAAEATLSIDWSRNRSGRLLRDT